MTPKTAKTVLKLDGYNIITGQNIFALLGDFVGQNKYSSAFILADKTVYGYWGAQIKNVLPGAKTIVIPPGEKHKNLKTLERIWQFLFKNGADRHSVLINLGGGVVGDMGGFAAAAYMRGISFVQVPTTLLAQVDASVGGKTAVDLNGAKNIIGSFKRPDLVLIDAATLKTLDKRQLVSGMGEVIKHGLIKDKKYFEDIKKINITKASPAQLAQIINKSCQIKAYFVGIDEHEKGPRKILNFGHTIGHAVETISFKTKTPLLHGEAVALGMIAEAKLSALAAGLTDKEFNDIKQTIKKAGLPVSYKGAKVKDILNLISKDKKNKGKKIKWTLLSSIGKAVYDKECAQADIEAALKEIL